MNTTRVVARDQEPPAGSTPIGEIETAVREAALQWGHEIGPCRRSQAFAPSGPGLLDATIIALSLLMALGLGWIVGSTLYGFFPADPTSLFNAANGVFNSDVKPGNETIVSASNTGRDATPGEPTAWRVVSAAGHGHEAFPGAARPAIPSPSPTALTAPQNTSPRKPATAALEPRTRIIPVPETRPTTVQGWVVRDVAGGTAVLEGPNGVLRTTRGETVPGLGRVDFIVRWGSRWIVGTSRGLITTP